MLIDTNDSEMIQQFSATKEKELRDRKKLFRSLGVDTIEIRTDQSLVTPIIEYFKMREKNIDMSNSSENQETLRKPPPLIPTAGVSLPIKVAVIGLTVVTVIAFGVFAVMLAKKLGGPPPDSKPWTDQIGRASCRERV